MYKSHPLRYSRTCQTLDILSVCAYPETMIATKVVHLTRFNTDALLLSREIWMNNHTNAGNVELAGKLNEIVITATTAIFPGNNDYALALLHILMRSAAHEFGKKIHPYQSMHAIGRKLNNPTPNVTWYEVRDDGPTQDR